MPLNRTRIPKTCLYCGQNFMARTDGPGNYCSRTCQHLGKRTRVTLTCNVCGNPFESAAHRVLQGTAKYCSRKCQRNSLAISVEEALANYDVAPVTGCHIYRGSKDIDGYAVAGKKPRHRLCRTILERYYGVDISNPNIIAMHSCDTPPCINPAHISPGTHSSNSADKVTKGRQARGERQGQAKLTEHIVREIRELLASKAMSQVAIAKKYGISRANIYYIKTSHIWAHVA